MAQEFRAGAATPPIHQALEGQDLLPITPIVIGAISTLNGCSLAGVRTVGICSCLCALMVNGQRTHDHIECCQHP